jgi:hypothetical protein
VVPAWLEESARSPPGEVPLGQECLLVARRFPVISLREINADDLGSSRKSIIWLLLDPVFGLFPCIFPADLGFAPRDGFATDWNLRQLVCVSGVRRAGARVSREIPAVSRGFGAGGLRRPNRRPAIGPEDPRLSGDRLQRRLGRFGLSQTREPGGRSHRWVARFSLFAAPYRSNLSRPWPLSVPKTRAGEAGA